MNREAVLAWVTDYERAWRSGDPAAVEALFTEHAHYRPSPYESAEVGHDAIKAFWPEDEGTTFTMSAELVALDGDVAVVRVEVHYLQPREQEYRDLWLLRFAPDGRVADFEEWAYWPGKPYSAGTS
jgi:ketosteroid isomerase-like protein